MRVAILFALVLFGVGFAVWRAKQSDPPPPHAALDLFVHRPKMGYRYRIDLPRDADLREGVWACYARPAEKGVTGNRTFFVNQMGDILATGGGGGEPAPDAAGSGSWTFVR